MSLVQKFQQWTDGVCNSDTPTGHAEVIVFEIIDDLKGRSGGFDDMFENIDTETKEELLQTNVDRVVTRLTHAMRMLG